MTFALIIYYCLQNSDYLTVISLTFISWHSTLKMNIPIFPTYYQLDSLILYVCVRARVSERIRERVCVSVCGL